MTTRRDETLNLPTGGGGNLRGRLSYGDAFATAAVVYAHGFGSVGGGGEKAQAVERACARRGWTLAAIDFRGHGESSGAMHELRGSGLLDDLDVVADHLQARGVRTLGLCGSSMGGWACAWFALRRPELVAACVLMAPAFDFLRNVWNRLDDAQRRAWREAGRMRVRNEWVDTEIGYGLYEEADQFPPDQLAAGWRHPLLIFHGMQDEVVPYRQTLDVVGHMPPQEVEVRLYRSGDHRLLARADEMAEAGCQFFEKHLGRRS